MTTAVVTDSTTSLAPGVLERPDVRVVPLTFHFGEDETYTDKIDMTNEEFYERLRDSDVFPTTAQPSPGAFVEAYEALSDYDDILVLTLSSKFSGTYDSALQAAGMVDRPVQVLDTKSAEMGSGLILLEALALYRRGWGFRRGQARRRAGDRGGERALRRWHAGVSGQERAYRKGAASPRHGPRCQAGSEIADGEIVPFKRTRGRKRQLATIVEEVRPAAEAGRPLYFGHIAAPELLSELAEQLGVEVKLIAEIGGVVGSHVGLGAYGVAHL